MPLISVLKRQVGKAASCTDPRARRPAIPLGACRAGSVPLAWGEMATRRFAPVPHPELQLVRRCGMSDIGPAGRARVLVCITCRAANAPADPPDADPPDADPRGAAARAPVAPGAVSAVAGATAAPAAGDSDISVQRIRCLGNCSRG